MTNPAEVVRRYYAAFNAGDTDTMLDLLVDDVRHDVNQGGTRHGREAFRAFLEHMDRCYDEKCEDVVVLEAEDGRHAAAEFMVHGTYKAQDADLPPAEGQRYLLPAGAFFEIDDGKIARVTTYYNLTDWMRQVSA